MPHLLICLCTSSCAATLALIDWFQSWQSQWTSLIIIFFWRWHVLWSLPCCFARRYTLLSSLFHNGAELAIWKNKNNTDSGTTESFFVMHVWMCPPQFVRDCKMQDPGSCRSLSKLIRLATCMKTYAPGYWILHLLQTQFYTVRTTCFLLIMGGHANPVFVWFCNLLFQNWDLSCVHAALFCNN